MYKNAIIGAVVCTVLGFLSAILTGNFDVYGTLALPPFAPPAIVFPIVWTLLYILLGGSAGTIFGNMKQSRDKDRAVLLFATMLIFNYLWTPLFFGLSAYFAALVDIAVMIALSAWLLPYWAKNSRYGKWVLAGYLAWLVYAFYLNLGVLVLN